MSNYLITGSRNNTPHITSMDDASFNSGVVGGGVCILERGEKLRAEIVSSNTVRIYDGDLVAQGRHIRIETSEYIDLTINNGDAGMKRNDLIVARYEKDEETGVESVDFDVIQGEASASNPVDPEYTDGDIFAGDILVEFPIYRITIDGITPNTPELLAKFVPSADMSYSLDRGNEILENANLNDYNKIGIYFCPSAVVAGTLSNTPYTSGNFKLIVEHCGTSSWVRQTLINLASSKARTFIRTKTSSWSDWVEVQTKPINNNTQTASASASIACSPGNWINSLNLTLTEGTWIVNGAAVFDNLPSANANNLGVSISDTSSNYNWEAMQRHMVPETTAQVTMNVSRVITVTGTKQIYLTLYSNIERNATNRKLTAVRVL